MSTSPKKLYDSLGMLSVAMAMSHLKDNIPKLKTEIEKEDLEKKKEIIKKEEEKISLSEEKSFDSNDIITNSSKKSKISISRKSKNSNCNLDDNSMIEKSKIIYTINDNIEITYSSENISLNQRKKLDFYSKSLVKKHIIENQIEKKRKNIEKIEKENLTYKPNVNKLSEKIIKDKFNKKYIPINERGIHLNNLKQTQYMINEKKKNLDVYKLQKGKSKMNNYQINNFISKQFEWKEQIDDKKLGSQIIKKVKSEEKINNIINEKKKKSLSVITEKLANEKIENFCKKYNIKRNEIYERLYKEGITKEKENKKLKEKYKNSFKPYINKFNKLRNNNVIKGKKLKQSKSDISLIEKKMIDVNKSSKKHYTKANSIVFKKSSKNLSKSVSLNDNDKKDYEIEITEENENNKINNVKPLNYRNEIRKSNKFNYDTNHSTGLTNNNNNINIIDSNSKREKNQILKYKESNNITIQNLNKTKEENNESNYQINNNNKNNIKTLMTMDFNFIEDQKNFEESENKYELTSILKNSINKDFNDSEQPSWINQLIEVSNEKITNKVDLKNKLYNINIRNSSSTKEYKPFIVDGKNSIFSQFFIKK